MYQDPNSGQWLNDDGTPMYGYLPSGYDQYIDPNAQAAQAPASVGDLAGAPSDTTAHAPSSLGPFTDTFSPPEQSGLPNLPGVGPAPAFNFHAPSVDEALNDPGYQFVVGQGTDALQRWAAAKGTLNDSATAKALTDYGQSAATQQYKNVWDRMFSTAREAYAPQLQTWQAQNQRSALGYSTEAEWNQHANDMNYENAWKKFLNGQDFYKWNVDTALRTAGA